MGFMAAPLAMPILTAIGVGTGAATSIYSLKKQGDAQKKAIKAQNESRYLFSEDERAAARHLLMSSLMGGGQGYAGMQQAPQPGQQGVPRNATAQQIQQAQFMKMVMDRYGRPQAPYQGYLQGLQERRDARSGVAAVPPQGGASPSAQRQTTGSASGYGRTY